MSAEQPRLTPLGVMVLALLREGAMHPYEMVRLLRQRRDDRMVSITNGTLYHTVDRLNQQELLVEVGVDREGNRPERTTYRLTDAGRDAVTEWVRRELPRNDRTAQFRVALAEAHNLDRDEVIALLTLRREGLAADLEVHRRGLSDATGRGVQPQFLIEVDRQADLIETDLRWTDRLLQRLADPDYAWGVDSATSPTPVLRTDSKDSK
ncbi:MULTISPECIES: PadR family transcriptional regulator [Gordonia]|uniref:PadR family transcriptional regulator n=2 Tax=Gordonia TaxID=2053 RepID=A0ABN3H524_9ACTN|nr:MULTISPECIES: PadR family transcriptional regulator [Gordonia]AUH67686.1 PadR family transcriptional regulator [Gordonia sp. YC-JH1]MBY4568809.1 transcriptional regulator [Gordonia sihwensis]GAC62022.1 putative PadR family transcriptional regulator [Gordonia sihwensis NBRC 108236]